MILEPIIVILKKNNFLNYSEELYNLNDFEIILGEGVSGLILKEDWDYVGEE